MRQSITSLILLLLVPLHLVNGQESGIKSGELLLQLRQTEDIEDLWPNHARGMMSSVKLLSARKNIYRIQFDKRADLSLIKRNLQAHPSVLHVQYNHILKRRGGTSPDDPLFAEQWTLERIGAPDLWDQTTGGITPCGDTIVVAVFDFGIDIEHEDISSRLWINRQEIPSNSFDDDDNGYIDDVLGLNLDTGNDKHMMASDYHGTEVAGVIGAQGNNSVGIAGINWEVKLMILSSEDKDEALAIEAFEYIYQQRNLYNESNGIEGAYVVSVNNSWGREGFYEDDFPLLCGMFNDLGDVGILSVGSTENDQVNTDVFGDIPSDCSSEFLIVVTSTDENDMLAVGGFGKENVDLGAPGESVRVLARDNGYGYDSGTSFSAPLVAGSIALLYSLPEATFCDDAKLSPTDAIRSLKRYLLEGVTPVLDLQDRTVSGGRLNLKNTAGLVTAQSDPEIVKIFVFPNPSQGTFFIRGNQSILSTELRIINPLGQIIYSQTFAGQANIDIDGSSWPNGTYFLQIQRPQNSHTVKILKW